jgi:hypothetical protein
VVLRVLASLVATTIGVVAGATLAVCAYGIAGHRVGPAMAVTVGLLVAIPATASALGVSWVRILHVRLPVRWTLLAAGIVWTLIAGTALNGMEQVGPTLAVAFATLLLRRASAPARAAGDGLLSRR